ncbi:hypothetical protein BHAOGJBA_6382 [Methylobacterium hispanicum]|uniref:Uncharacterized protein n=1 Tax=Methylobacterium hispanicum TaxID=270350 RepID=A0AAV4ZY88_9HYPH|nr:hypothetical protein BHAOGJBA_6382 [Methylobacterium hispanicum]
MHSRIRPTTLTRACAATVAEPSPTSAPKPRRIVSWARADTLVFSAGTAI